MWSCGFTSRHPVELVFHLPNIEYSSSESHGLSKITVWNYNKGIKVSKDQTQPLQALHVFIKTKTNPMWSFVFGDLDGVEEPFLC